MARLVQFYHELWFEIEAVRSIDFLLADLRTFSDTGILVHIPLHAPHPPHQSSLAVACRHHLLQAGLVLAVLCWAHAHVLHGLCQGHHHQYALLVLHVKQVEYNTL